MVQSPSLTSHHADDGFHEIQLNGKQLVFLFMAVTVVSVVIFLCGVLVGRGVLDERGMLADPALDQVSGADLAAAAVSASAPPGAAPAAEPAPPDDLSYFRRLEQPNLPPEDLQPVALSSPPPVKVDPAPPPVPAESPGREAGGTESATEPVAPPSAEPAPVQGYTVQLAALNSRTDAEEMAERLASKGYAAYVVTPTAGTPRVYRVRVGMFPTRQEADTVAAKLQKEERFNPWVTR